jgi:hypothetical protein
LKSILLLLLVLFIVVNPVYGQLSLSDATGLIDRLDVETSGHVFEIKLVSNFDLTDYTFEKDQKQLTLYFDSGLENNLAEIIIPQNLLSGDFVFYLNEQEFFPKIQSNEKINFITLNFTGLGTNVLKITGSEYLSNLDEITPIENKTYETLDDSDFLPPSGEFDQTSSNDYLIWLIVGSIVIIIVIIVVSKFLKNKN